MPEAKTVTYIYDIRHNARLRVWLQDRKGVLVDFAVTLECEVKPADWRAVVRYDTTGGTVHRDRLKPDGDYLTHRETVRLGAGFEVAIGNAQRDLAERADVYIERFLAMLESD